MRLPVLAVALVSSAISDTAVAQSAPGNPMVQWYASEYGVAATEAEARLARLSSIAAVEKELQERFPNQFGGLYVQHSPQFRVVVKMTGARSLAASYIGSDLRRGASGASADDASTAQGQNCAGACVGTGRVLGQRGCLEGDGRHKDDERGQLARHPRA